MSEDSQHVPVPTKYYQAIEMFLDDLMAKKTHDTEMTGVRDPIFISVIWLQEQIAEIRKLDPRGSNNAR